MEFRQAYRVTNGPAPIHMDGSSEEFQLVVGALEQPDAVEEALGCCRFGTQVVGLDWADVRTLADGRAGLARVVEGAGHVEKEVLAARNDLIARGYGNGLLLIEMHGYVDDRRWDLHAFADLIEVIFTDDATNRATTIVLKASRSRTVLIGFPAGRSPKGAHR